MKNETTNKYNYYINIALDAITIAEQNNVPIFNVNKILKKQGNKRILQKIGELKEIIETRNKDDLMGILMFSNVLSTILYESMDVYNKSYPKIYQDVCETIQGYKNLNWLDLMGDDDFNAYNATFTSLERADICFGDISLEDALKQKSKKGKSR